MSFWKSKKVLITGGTSGLGKALVGELERRGAEVLFVARSAEPPGIRADVAEKRDIHRVSGEALARLGRIDVLINNASTLGPTPLRSLLDTECEDLEAVLQANLVGPFRLTKALLPGMLLRGSGLVVNLSSDAAVAAYPGWGVYGASKAALDHLSRIWAEELAAKGIRFLAIDPGDMNTPMHRAAIPDADFAALRKPEEVARELAAFLARNAEGVRFTAKEWRALP